MHFVSLILLVVASAVSAATDELQISQRYPHANAGFTQGFIIDNGVITETTGRYGYSKLLRYRLGDGVGQTLLNLPSTEFGEGLTQFNGYWYWLTWKAGKAYQIDTKNHSLTNTFSYSGEGWGISHDGRYIITSNGTNRLDFRRPQNFEIVRSLYIFDHGTPLNRINELEWARGYIYANIWQQDRIVKIDPDSGEICASFNMSFLRDEAIGPQAESLNGIAYDAALDKLFITGKYWQLIFEVEEKPTTE